jgi:hypothetical protein
LLSGWNLLDNVTQKTLIQKARNATKSDDFKEIIIEARNKITAKRTGTSSSGGGGGGGSDPNIAARQDALNRIKVVLQGAKSGYFTNINNILNGIKGELETKTGTEITDHEKH